MARKKKQKKKSASGRKKTSPKKKKKKKKTPTTTSRSKTTGKKTGGAKKTKAPSSAADEGVATAEAEVTEPAAKEGESESAVVGSPADAETPEETDADGAVADHVTVASTGADIPGEDDVAVIDLDLDVDDEQAVAQLIAETVAVAPTEGAPSEAEVPLIDLDADVEDRPTEEGKVEAPEPTEAEAESDVEPRPPTDAEPTEESPAEEPPAEALPGEAPAVGAEASEAPATEPDVEDAAAEVLRRLEELGPVSSPEVRSRLLAEALAHAEHKEARYRVPFSEGRTVARWKALAASTILVLAAGVAVAPPGWARAEPRARLAAGERAQNIRTALLLQAQQVDAFRVREQRLPETLDEVVEQLPGLRYVRSGGRAYQLIAYQADGSAIVYDSANPAAAFDSASASWMTPETPP